MVNLGISQTVRLMLSTITIFQMGVTSANCAINSKDVALWQSIRQADTRVTKSRLQWQSAISIAPNPKIDPEEVYASAMSNPPDKNINKQIIQKNAASLRDYAIKQKQGTFQTESLTFEFDGKSVYCDVVCSDSVVIGQSPSTTHIGRFIDIDDGSNHISLNGVGDSTPTKGVLVRGDEDILSHSAPIPGDLQWLAGSPISYSFSPQDTSTHQNSDGTILLEKIYMRGDFKLKTDMLISRNNYRPISMEFRNALSNQLLARYRATGYRNFSGGISVPSHIVKESLAGSKDVYLTQTWDLKSAQFNALADVSNLKNGGVPQGTVLADYRFGKGATYRVTGPHLPSDESVKKLINNQIGNGQSLPSARTSNRSVAAIIFLGSLCIVIGIAFWKRSIMT